MSNQNNEKNPTWFYVALAVVPFTIIIVIGMVKDLMWIF